MSAALRYDTPPEPAPACTHDGFIEYGERNASSTDDTYTIKGRCMLCDSWYELWIAKSTGDIYNERALDSAEIADLRRSVWL